MANRAAPKSNVANTRSSRTQGRQDEHPDDRVDHACDILVADESNQIAFITAGAQRCEVRGDVHEDQPEPVPGDEGSPEKPALSDAHGEQHQQEPAKRSLHPRLTLMDGYANDPGERTEPEHKVIPEPANIDGGAHKSCHENRRRNQTNVNGNRKTNVIATGDERKTEKEVRYPNTSDPGSGATNPRAHGGIPVRHSSGSGRAISHNSSHFARRGVISVSVSARSFLGTRTRPSAGCASWTTAMDSRLSCSSLP